MSASSRADAVSRVGQVTLRISRRISADCFVQVALYEDSLSAPFSRLRRNAIISASAALSLLVALVADRRAGRCLRPRQATRNTDGAGAAGSARSSPVRRPPIRPASTSRPSACPPRKWAAISTTSSRLPGGRVSFVVGDVSGHGISAALLMGLIHGAMSNPPWGASEDPDRAAARLNDLLLTKSSGERFASLFWCAYDPGLARSSLPQRRAPAGRVAAARDGRNVAP